MSIEVSEKGCLIRVHVRPAASRQAIIISETPFKIHVWLKQQAQRGKANKELLRLFKKVFKGYPVFLVAGMKSTLKTLEVMGVDPLAAQNILRSITSEN
ncbi:MAG: DUF167 family protein [Candidatus Heimdallarchaeota archaeon]